MKYFAEEKHIIRNLLQIHDNNMLLREQNSQYDDHKLTTSFLYNQVADLGSGYVGTILFFGCGFGFFCVSIYI